MLKRLGFGLIKGLIVGGAIGAAFHFGLGVTTATGLIAYLIAMGTGATTGVLTGKPPWRHSAWIESLLKAGAGLGVGALAYWAATKWASFGLPLELPGVDAATPWTEVVLAFTAAIGTTFGALVELDNNDGDEEDTSPKRVAATKARVEIEEAELVEAEPVESTKSARR